MNDCEFVGKFSADVIEEYVEIGNLTHEMRLILGDEYELYIQATQQKEIDGQSSIDIIANLLGTEVNRFKDLLQRRNQKIQNMQKRQTQKEFNICMQLMFERAIPREKKN